MRGLKDGAKEKEARPTFPDVRGQVEDIILGNRDAKLVYALLCPVKGLSVSECPDAHPRPSSEASVCRLKHQKRTKVERISDEQKGVKTILFYLYVPREIRGPMRGLKDGAAWCVFVQHFLMSVVRLKTLFWEIEVISCKTSLWSSQAHSPETERL
ncbi:hypothetical protein TNIN_249431 [Trichonephila inaurata madagascariensis]|uniref:Uncharacterized protein n=1 Tax=Trichonephila inaurata madagascariensis TaxID=2747483 RepID=A0A8X6XG22_9ARAC|nr:hypothetical protein TNIN_249431 [Trichonephila inaurata madagascariensis]